MQNRVVVDKALDYEKRLFLEHIKSFKKSIEEKNYFLVAGASINGIGWVDAFRFFIDEINSCPSPAKDLVISSMYRINMSCPLALPAYFDILCGEKVEASGGGRRISSKDLFKQFEKVPDQFLNNYKELLLKGLYSAGSSGTVSIEPTTDSEEVRVDEGLKTLCKPASFFEPYLETQEISDCCIVLYSGSIVDVSEIHHILQASYETKKKVILICTGYSEDVQNTLLVNWQQGKTFVLPFLVEDSLETINEFRDIAMVTGESLLSKDTGALLSGVEIHDKKNHSAFFNSGKRTLKLMLDEQEVMRCARLRKEVLEKIKKEKVDDVKELLGKRFARLSSRTVDLRIFVNETERGVIEDKASAFFSYFLKCAQQGVTRVKGTSGVDYLPTLEFEKARRAAHSDITSIKNIRAMIRLEE